MDKDDEMSTEFDNAILQVAERIKRILDFIPEETKKLCEEIRLRVGLPLCLTVRGSVVFVCENSSISQYNQKNCVIVTCDELERTLSLLCRQSVYRHESEIRQGFISLPRGCRAGVCGVFNADGMLTTVTSINIRIARQIFDCARPLLPYSERGMLIAGPPGCGKTTMLRDLVRLLSDGCNGRYRRVAVIDSRGEISGGTGTLDLGKNTDVLYTGDKAVGAEIALRTMFPDFIAFDEIGTVKELESLTNCFNAGVCVITTAHCLDAKDIMHREVTRNIVQNGAIAYVALLSKNIGDVPQILCVEELMRNVFV